MSNKSKKIVIVGATSAIAEQCARLWVKDSVVDMTLVGRDAGRLARVAADLLVRSPKSSIEINVISLADAMAITQLANEVAAAGVIDTVLIAHGSLPDQSVCQQDLAACDDALAVNGISPVLFAEAFAGHMQKANHGTLAIIGSVAGDRGRKSNYVYGSAKGLVTRYAQGLQHRLAATNVKVVLIKPGPTDTPMTAHLKQQGGKLASVEDVAQAIVKGIDQGSAVVYAPAKWALIMMVIRHLPRFVFNRMDI
ncbi:MAG: SDR family NAD(P)-dependent oxidoreductase [Pseudomonadota bacterium]